MAVLLLIGSPDVQPACCSVHMRWRHHDWRDWTGGTGAGASIGTAMSAGCASAASSPAAGFWFHGLPFNVVGNSKPHRSNSGRLRSLLCALDHGVVISISSLRSLTPMNAPSCHLGFDFVCLAPPSRTGVKFNRFPLSAVRLTSMQFVSCAPVATNLVPHTSFSLPWHSSSLGIVSVSHAL